MSTYNIDFYEEMTKIIFQLSSNTHKFIKVSSKLGSHYFVVKCTVLSSVMSSLTCNEDLSFYSCDF